MYTMTITTPADVAVYTITSTATIPQNTFSTNTALTKNYSFTLTVQSDCVLSVITDKIIIDMFQKIAFPVVTQDVTFLDSIATGHAVPAYCGLRTYSLTPAHSFLTISGTTMSLLTSLVPDVGLYPVDITVALTNYPMVTPKTYRF